MSAAINTLLEAPPVPAAVEPRAEAALAVRPDAQGQPRSDYAVVSAAGAPAAGPARSDALLTRLAALAPGDRGRVAVRTQVIEWYLPMATYLARRFASRGEPLADLTQVAVIGLIKAVDRYDPRRGVPFASYAIPTIVGQIKRHFRDAGWTVRVPRQLQELRLHLVSVTEDLTHALLRSPTTAELAVLLGVSQGDVLAARRSANAYRPLSVEQPASGSEGPRLLDSLGGSDAGIEAVDRRETIRAGLAGLPARERRIIVLRYYADMTQTQIAAEIGVSQMHVSRLLAQTLARLRERMLADTDTAAARPGPARGPYRVTDGPADMRGRR